MPRDVVLLSQRARLIEAMVDVAGARGYAASTIGDVIAAARVSRTTFYEHFADKEDCFVAAYEEVSGLHFQYVVDAAKQGRGAVGELQAGVRAYLEVLGEDPAYARVSLVEVMAAGARAAASREATHARYVAALRDWHAKVRAEDPAVPQMPDQLFHAAVGGVSDLAGAHVRQSKADPLSRMAPAIVTFLLNVGTVPAGRQLAAALSSLGGRRG